MAPTCDARPDLMPPGCIRHMRSLLTLALITAAIVPGAAAQPLTQAQIDEAIGAGMTGKQKSLVITCAAVIGFGQMFKREQALDPRGSFGVTMSLTQGRIAALAADARRVYKPFGASDVPADLKSAAVLVDIDPDPPDLNTETRAVWYTPSIQQVVIKAFPDRKRFVLPAALQLDPVEWKDAPGGPMKGNRGRARFNVGDVRELPPGELEIAVVTEAGERACIVPARDRRRVFGP
jgi:hypothetical protein